MPHGLSGEDPADRLRERGHAAVVAHAASSSSTSSRRSFASAARRRASTSATSPTGIRLSAVRRAIRGGIGSAGICEVTWSSMNRDAAHTCAVSTPCSIPSPVRASQRNSAATRFSEAATGYAAAAIGSAPARDASTAIASAFPPVPWQ